MLQLEPLPVESFRNSLLEPIDPEVLLLLVSTKDESPAVATDAKMKNEQVDDFMPLNVVVSTPTSVESYNPEFSKVEMQDLMNLLGSEPSTTVTPARAVKKLVKRTKKCTYAARRREVATLRVQVASLEKTLGELRELDESAGSWRQRADDEKEALDNAQSENKRLRDVVSAREAKIRQVDAYLSSLAKQR